MPKIFYENSALIDTSAILSLFNDSDPLHNRAEYFYKNITNIDWFVLNVTTHESFTRSRYDMNLKMGIKIYDNLRSEEFNILKFNEDDENKARGLIEKYEDKTLSFHDALCAAVMIRYGIYKIFSFDSDFWAFGFNVMPGYTVHKKAK